MKIYPIIEKQLKKVKGLVYNVNGEEVSLDYIKDNFSGTVEMDVSRKSLDLGSLDFSKRYKFSLAKSALMPSEFNSYYNKGSFAPDSTLYGYITYKVPGFSYIQVATRDARQWVGWIEDSKVLDIVEY